MSWSLCLPGPPSKASCIFVLISALLSFLCLGGGLGGLPPSAHAPLSNRGHVAHYPAFLSYYLRRWFKASRRWMLLDTHQWHPGSCYVSCLFLAFPGSDSSLVYLYIDSWTRPVIWPPLLSPSCAPHFSFTFSRPSSSFSSTHCFPTCLNTCAVNWPKMNPSLITWLIVVLSCLQPSLLCTLIPSLILFLL